VLPEPKLKLIKLPPSCKKIIDLHDVPALMFTTFLLKRTFGFLKKPVQLFVDVFWLPEEQHGDQSIKNEYASMITGQETFGPLTVVCLCDQKIISMQQFVKLCTDNGMVLRAYSDKERKFSGIHGDMLHRLVRGTGRRLLAGTLLPVLPDAEAEAAGCKTKAPEHPSLSTGSSNGAAADVGAGTLSLVPAAGADVRRSDRSRKQKVIFDPSVVKTEGGDQP